MPGCAPPGRCGLPGARDWIHFSRLGILAPGMTKELQHARVRYEEARDGHNWENWRDRLRSGLSWLFPGPLWMVYE